MPCVKGCKGISECFLIIWEKRRTNLSEIEGLVVRKIKVKAALSSLSIS